MEHHTYAKSDAKSWTVEQTRRLVTKRINADHMFKKPSLRNEREWKAFKEMAKIDDFDWKELRNQWQALLQVYRINRNGISAPITNHIIAAINKKWEFFGEIHQYMIKKNDHHSYAQNATNDLNAQSKVTKQVTKNVTIEVAPEIVPPSPKTPKNVVEVNPVDVYPKKDIEKGSLNAAEIKTEKGEEANDNGVEVVVAPEPFVFIPETAKNVPPNQQDNAKEDEGKKGFIAPTKNKTENRSLTLPIGERGPLSQSLPPTPSENNENKKTSAQPEARESRKRPAEEELSEKDKDYKHCSRYYQIMEKRLKLLGRALSKMLIPLATFLDVQIEVSDLEELFAADSEPSPVGSVSSTDEDSNQ